MRTCKREDLQVMSVALAFISSPLLFLSDALSLLFEKLLSVPGGTVSMSQVFLEAAKKDTSGNLSKVQN